MEGCPDYVVDVDFECGSVSCEMETRWKVVVVFPREDEGRMVSEDSTSNVYGVKSTESEDLTSNAVAFP
jgi:hypothetical protein